ncbi:MAG: CAP domain-containing protein [Gaiellaceae bacterium]
MALLGAFAAPHASSSKATNRVTLSGLESGVLQQLNKIRAQHGLIPLKLNARLTAAATQHSREMGADGYFEHNSVDGTAFWKRIGHWYASSGFGYWSVGENLLWSSPEVEAAGALQLWMNSPEHRANILTPRWREIGVSAVHLQAAPGTYRGLEVTIVTTDFGVRR